MSSKPSSNTTQPAFLIEMGDQIRHIIMKRHYFLRSTRARTLFCREKIAGKSWLEVALIEKPKADVLPWDQAHNLAERFKAELKADVFVEPANLAGRHHQLTAPKNSVNPLNGDEHGNGNRGHGTFGFDPTTPGVGAGTGMDVFGGSNIPGMPNIAGFQNPADFLPAHVREALSFGDDKKSSEITLPALRELPAFSKLPEATMLMFEVEAVQVLQGLMAQVGLSEHSESSLVALTKLDNVSKLLKRFLAEAMLLEAA
ncbi:hypothetical protein KBF38_21670 [bacterium]|nr:hypothetical protein [bacterium]